MNNKPTLYRETMWAEMKPDLYDGENCDQLLPEWDAYADGDKEGDRIDIIEFAAKTFPPGTKVTISEPLCPNCRETRSYDDISLKSFADKCDCGFDWKTWVEKLYA